MEEEDTTIGQKRRMPQKRFFRMRAHCNPLSSSNTYEYPVRPEDFDVASHYPGSVRVLDVGCGFGGLLVGLAPVLPEMLILGLEIRDKVCDYVRLRIEALRSEHPGQYQNASVLKSNAMRYLPNYVAKGQLQKMFFCFPDPHFKAKNHRRRIVTPALLAEYAYAMAPGGRLYFITDVEELYEWMVRHTSEHPLFARLSPEELEADPVVPVMREMTEEGKKVARGGGAKFYAGFVRLPDEAAVFPPLW